ncbi:MAG: OmpL47-type beta-barrel domain-containing protein, partial [Aggregatilineales bacterium]
MATDQGCLGIDEITYTLDGVTQTYGGTPFSVTGEGSHQLDYFASDGTTVENSSSLSFSIDTVVPDITVTTDRPPDTASGWYSQPVTVTFSSTDATSGIAALNYDWNGAGWQPYTTALTVAADGVHQLNGQTQDVAGWEALTGIGIRLDQTPPDVTLTTDRPPDSPQGWYRSPVEITATTQDATSQTGTAYRINHGAWQPYLQPYWIPATGQHTTEVLATDEALNTQQVSLTVQLDFSHPAIEIIPDRPANSASGWWTRPVIATIVSSDDVSGVDTVSYDWNRAGWQDYGVPIRLDTGGTHTLLARVYDQAGWETQATTSFPIDLVAPESTLDIIGGENTQGWYGETVDLQLSATDVDSGVASLWIEIDGGGWHPYVNPIRLQTGGSHIIRYYAVDEAGLIEAVQTHVLQMDNRLPVFHNMQAECQAGSGERPFVQFSGYAQDSETGLKNAILRVSRAGYADVVFDGDSGYVFNGSNARESIAFYYLVDTPVLHEFEIIVEDEAGNIARLETTCDLSDPDAGLAALILETSVPSPQPTLVPSLTLTPSPTTVLQPTLTPFETALPVAVTSLPLTSSGDEVMFAMPVNMAPFMRLIAGQPGTVSDIRLPGWTLLSSDNKDTNTAPSDIAASVVLPATIAFTPMPSPHPTGTPVPTSAIRIYPAQTQTDEVTNTDAGETDVDLDGLAQALAALGLAGMSSAGVVFQMGAAARQRREELDAQVAAEEKQRQAALADQKQRAAENVAENEKQRAAAKHVIDLEGYQSETNKRYMEWLQARQDAKNRAIGDWLKGIRIHREQEGAFFSTAGNEAGEQGKAALEQGNAAREKAVAATSRREAEQHLAEAEQYDSEAQHYFDEAGQHFDEAAHYLGLTKLHEENTEGLRQSSSDSHQNVTAIGEFGQGHRQSIEGYWNQVAYQQELARQQAEEQRRAARQVQMSNVEQAMAEEDAALRNRLAAAPTPVPQIQKLDLNLDSMIQLGVAFDLNAAKMPGGGSPYITYSGNPEDSFTSGGNIPGVLNQAEPTPAPVDKFAGSRNPLGQALQWMENFFQNPAQTVGAVAKGIDLNLNYGVDLTAGSDRNWLY